MAAVVSLTSLERSLLSEARRAVLATTSADGSPRALPICFVTGSEDVSDGLNVYSPIDEKPKSNADPLALARVRDIAARPEVVVLVDRWDEEWSRLAWVQLRGRASLLDPGAAEHDAAVARLRAKYPQYACHDLESRPIIKVEVTALRSWSAAPAD